MEVIKKCIPGLFILLIITASGDCLAQQKAAAPNNQRPQFYFDKPITLDSLTRYVHSHSAIRFSFNSSKVKGDKVINLKKGTYTIDVLLQEIRKNTSLYYHMFNGYVIFQDNPPKQRTSAAKVAPRKTNNLSHHQPAAKPVTQTKPPANTAKIKAPAKPDTTSRVVAVVPGAPADTTVVRHKATDTSAANLLLTTMAGKTPDKEYIDVVKNTSERVQKGKPGVPVYKDSAGRAWLKDTMQTKTKVVRADVSKKDGRMVAQPSQNESEEDDGGLFRNWRWQYGLHWKAAIPVSGGSYYFTGPNNSSQPYNPLIPGIWLSAHNEHHEILLLVKPAEWTLYNNNLIKTDSGSQKIGSDSIAVGVRRNYSFIKSGGVYAGLQYNYHLNENLIIGAGIGYQTLGRTLGLKQTKRVIDTAKNKPQVPDTFFSVKGDSLTNRYLNASLILAKFEVAYKVGQVDLGAAVMLPLTSAFTSKSRDQKRPLSVQVFVRWRLRREEETF